jgi:RNA polymerase sigma-70 factor (ECF subfamily)
MADDPVRPPSGDLTRFLNAVGSPRAAGSEEAMGFVYDELRALARAAFRVQRADHTLQPTALVHEAFVKLFGAPHAPWHDRAHFFALAAKAMRQLLVDHARAQAALKRGGGNPRVTLSEGLLGAAAPECDLLDLDAALHELAGLDERQARVAELRLFAGLAVDEVASVLAISDATVERDWRTARAWIAHRLR